MIIKSHEADRYVSNPPKGLMIALVYGPDAGLVQDLYLTTSPRPGGEPDTPLYPTALTGTLVVLP